VWHVGVVTELHTRALFTTPVKTMAMVAVPCGVAAYLATKLPVSPVAQIAAGLAFAACWLALAWLAVPSVRSDLTFIFSFIRRMLPGRLGGRSVAGRVSVAA